MQTILVFITFALAVGFLLKKFIYDPIVDSRKTTPIGTLDGGKTKCGKSDCGCH
ncbi:hypothetical protein [Luteirhabdus pelagi]|uniref:hypothetical protein n=1 Tax=Luteirhabdus pelagi TaxID=2792783 RepID=UPI00193981F6|nr:hypothetical protein [Luteirhabdus pelagi]MCT8339233.1 hypothetical protein [Thermobacterium salinum]